MLCRAVSKQQAAARRPQRQRDGKICLTLFESGIAIGFPRLKTTTSWA
jgi:hypothetical protein